MRFIDDLPEGLTERKDLRRPCGINIIWGRVPVFAYQLYEVTYSDNSSAVVRGQNLHTSVMFQHINGTKKQKLEAAKSLRPDLENAMQSASILLTAIKHACEDLDSELPKTRAPRRNRIRASLSRKGRSSTKPEGRNKK